RGAAHRITPRPQTCALCLHDALPISARRAVTAFTTWSRWAHRPAIVRNRSSSASSVKPNASQNLANIGSVATPTKTWPSSASKRSEEHTSELQSRENLVCRLLLEKEK